MRCISFRINTTQTPSDCDALSSARVKLIYTHFSVHARTFGHLFARVITPSASVRLYSRYAREHNVDNRRRPLTGAPSIPPPPFS